MVGGITYSMHVSVSKLRETVKDSKDGHVAACGPQNPMGQ